MRNFGGLLPWTYFPETDGVVWMVSYHRLVRYDPAIPEEPAPPLRALITHVTLLASNRTLASAASCRRSISRQFHRGAFRRSRHSFASPVILRSGSRVPERAGVPSAAAILWSLTAWKRDTMCCISFRAPRNARAEATLAFTVRPPVVPHAAGMAQLCRVGIGLFSLSVWLIVFLQQRENAHLEKLVGERTASLRASEASVQASYELLHS